MQIEKLNELSKNMVKQLNQYIKQHKEEIANVTNMVATLKKEKSLLAGEIQKTVTTKKPSKDASRISPSRYDGQFRSTLGAKKKSKPVGFSNLGLTATPKASPLKTMSYSKTPKRFTSSMYKPNNGLSRSVSAASDLRRQLHPILKSARP